MTPKAEHIMDKALTRAAAVHAHLRAQHRVAGLPASHTELCRQELEKLNEENGAHPMPSNHDQAPQFPAGPGSFTHTQTAEPKLGQSRHPTALENLAEELRSKNAHLSRLADKVSRVLDRLAPGVPEVAGPSPEPSVPPQGTIEELRTQIEDLGRQLDCLDDDLMRLEELV